MDIEAACYTRCLLKGCQEVLDLTLEDLRGDIDLERFLEGWAGSHLAVKNCLSFDDVAVKAIHDRYDTR